MRTLAAMVLCAALLMLADIGTAWGVQHIVSQVIESTFGTINAALEQVSK